ncbi:hypothetical protein TNCV_1800861 [Trichonephila clavipes]|nr:hypothetical protein TNCV_1800861 [Trichonephila clavipes]
MRVILENHRNFKPWSNEEDKTSNGASLSKLPHQSNGGPSIAPGLDIASREFATTDLSVTNVTEQLVKTLISRRFTQPIGFCI